MVEGNDDLHVVLALLRKFNIPQTFQIVDCKGIDSLLKSLPVRLKASGVEKIALIVDADQNISGRWIELGAVLKPLVADFPDIPAQAGTFLKTNTNQEIMIWIMPNNEISGMLEDFINFLIPENDSLKPYVDQSLTEIETAGLNNYPLNQHSKALIHTWLAWQDSPGMPIGVAITHSYLDTNSDLGYEFVEWLRELFG